MINYRLLASVFLLAVLLAGAGMLRLDIDTDVVRSLPTGDKVIADAMDILVHHPIHDQIAVDIMLDGDDSDTLVDMGAFLEKKMVESGLFAEVGTKATGKLIPELALHVAQNLPLLFSAKELEQKVAPLLSPVQINLRLQKLYQQLGSMEGIGQAGFMELDPLGLKDLVLARMAPLAPTANSRFYRNSLLSADNHHLLVVARPRATGTDTASARRISELIDQCAKEIAAKYASSGRQITLTPVGAYRAALDNESIIRHDVQLALILATVGIGLLLLLAFPRPLIGLLSLVPALVGTAAALFVYSLLHSSISIMVLGFGGAIISITVDHGIAYLLFLDRPHEVSGKTAAKEVYAVGLMAIITSIGAFLILSCSGFLIFAELGLFTALGLFFSFLFVHSIFPKIFPVMPPGSERALPLRGLVDKLYSFGRSGALLATLLALFLLFFARPEFQVSLESMNTVSQATLAADGLFTKVWGNAGQQVFLLESAESIAGIQVENDRLLDKIEDDISKKVLSSAFVPSMLFPGKEREERNRAAWHDFWAHGRGDRLKTSLTLAGSRLGFASDAFNGFFAQLDPSFIAEFRTIPEKYYSLLGIADNSQNSELLQFITVRPGKNYQGREFFSRYGGDVKIFDAPYFTDRLANILYSTFSRMLVIIAVSVVALLLFFYLNLRLTLITLLPPLFAYVCTLGTMTLIGRPLDIPALMLSVVILGMGVDYSIFCVRAHQRYRDVDHPGYGLVRVAVFLSGSSTLIGFGVLALAEHSLLKSIGIVSLLGIGYSLLGAFLLLPPLLQRYLTGEGHKRDKLSGQKEELSLRIADRYRTLEPYPRCFARFKLKYDPMFDDLPRMLAPAEKITTIIDVGCGYGVPACWCLEQFPEAEVYGVDPDPERVRVAGLATQDRGKVICGLAPDLPKVPLSADVVLLLDMLHYLDDGTVAALLQKSFQALGEKGVLVTRFVIPRSEHPSWSWRLEDYRIKFSGGRPWYRSIESMERLMKEAGMVVVLSEVSAANRELVWMVGRVEKGTARFEKNS